MGQDRDADQKFQYEKLTWPEIQEKTHEGYMIIVPIGSTEDHGHHLPLDVDQLIVTQICQAAAKERDDSLLFPTINQGYLPHHADMPGGITIGWKTFVDHIIDIGVSLGHHGFSRILMVNGHGSNHHLVEQAARQITLQYSDVYCAMLSWWDIYEVQQVANEILAAGPEGSGHAGEMETSLYLYLSPQDVSMDKVTKSEDFGYKHFFNASLLKKHISDNSTPVSLVPMYTELYPTGVNGDPSSATADKGQQLFEAAVGGLNSILDEFQSLSTKSIDPKHHHDASYDVFNPFRPR